jgi:hypothetical protein
MMDQYFGAKELYEVVLRAKTPMTFGTRQIEAEEPVLYFENITMAVLQEQNSIIMAKGGWANLPHVIWEDRSEVRFAMSEGVMSTISMSVLLSANVTSPTPATKILVPKREGPLEIKDDRYIFPEHWPVENSKKKTFIFDYDRDVIQQKIYGKRVLLKPDLPEKDNRPCIKLYKDKSCNNEADVNRKYIIDYYYEYGDEALIYSIQKERFNGLFTLEGKFYTKDENEGIDYTNLLYMPKVRIVSDINLRLGERADPTMAVFNIIGLPETSYNNKDGLIMDIVRLNSDVDSDI